MDKKTVLSGMRPTGKLHIGHLFGALYNWKDFQNKYNCFYMVADWHALMSEYLNSENIKEYSYECVADWIASGIDPDKSTIFIQSSIPEHLELNMILSTLSPIPWLERCPTYKEQLQELKDKDIFTYAFLGYPVLQTADIILYKADYVPVGKDQLPHMELAREIIRRFHHIYKCNIFPEPEAMLTKTAKLLGTDKRKMSKSYNNYIGLSDEPEIIEKKVLSMITDESRIKLSDPGHPDICNVFSYFEIFAEHIQEELIGSCKNAKVGCRQCKKNLSEFIIEYLRPIREKRNDLMKNKNYLNKILSEGTQKAKAKASAVLKEVKDAVKI